MNTKHHLVLENGAWYLVQVVQTSIGAMKLKRLFDPFAADKVRTSTVRMGIAAERTAATTSTPCSGASSTSATSTCSTSTVSWPSAAGTTATASTPRYCTAGTSLLITSSGTPRAPCPKPASSAASSTCSSRSSPSYSTPQSPSAPARMQTSATSGAAGPSSSSSPRTGATSTPRAEWTPPEWTESFTLPSFARRRPSARQPRTRLTQPRANPLDRLYCLPDGGFEQLHYPRLPTVDKACQTDVRVVPCKVNPCLTVNPRTLSDAKRSYEIMYCRSGPSTSLRDMSYDPYLTNMARPYPGLIHLEDVNVTRMQSITISTDPLEGLRSDDDPPARSLPSLWHQDDDRLQEVRSARRLPRSGRRHKGTTTE